MMWFDILLTILLSAGVAMIGFDIGRWWGKRKALKCIVEFDFDDITTHGNIDGVEIVRCGLSVLNCRESIQATAIETEVKARLEEGKGTNGK